MLFTSLAEVTAKLEFAEEAPSIGLAVNESKTKYLLSTAKDTNALSEYDGDNQILKIFII